MGLKFGDDKEPRRSWARRPPPNYLSRRVQWKIFLLVGALMLVVLLMQEARDPRYYRWLQNLQEGRVAVQQEESVDTRLRAPEAASESDTDAASPLIRSSRNGAVRASSGPEGDDKADEKKARKRLPSPLDPLQEATHDAWATVRKEVADDLWRQLLSGLKAARDGDALPSDQQSGWAEAVAAMGVSWETYLDRAKRAIETDEGQLTEAEKKNWTDVILTLQDRWQNHQLPALEAYAEGEPPEAEQEDAFRSIQSSLDDLFLDDIRDNTVFRPDEKDAWFRLLERLQRREARELRNESVGTVGFLALYRQPEEYRGKLVTVEGSVRLGYHRPAPRNIYGIEGYYILWLKPSGSNSPIVVYALEVPEGFPDIRQMESEGEKPELEEPVAVTGFFFKRWAYRAQDSTRLAPLVLAKTVSWEPAPRSGKPAVQLPGAGRWAIMLGLPLAFGIAFALLVYAYTRHSRRTPLEPTLPLLKEENPHA
jgi:hypothetical protein